MKAGSVLQDEIWVPTLLNGCETFIRRRQEKSRMRETRMRENSNEHLSSIVRSAGQEQGCEGDMWNTEGRSVMRSVNIMEIERTINAE